MSWQPKSLMVTGGAGFIGSHFVRMWLDQNPGTFVLNIDNLTYAGNRDRVLDLESLNNYEFVQGDILDFELVSGLFEKHQIDTVVHFAAETHVDRSIKNPELFLQTNILGTHVLLNASLSYWDRKGLLSNGCRFHHISTDEVYGTLSKNAPPFCERSRYEPNSPYSASKAASDHIVRAYHHTYSLPVTISNCSNNYGPYQHGEKLIPTIIRSLVKRQKIPIYGDGTNIRDWLYVLDHCDAISRILKQGIAGEYYNIGGNCELSNLDLAKFLCDLYDESTSTSKSSDLIEFVEDRPGHDWRYAISAEKMHTDLGWLPSATLEDSLRETLHYYSSIYER